MIHIVGPGLIIGTVARQLCAWCGEKLMDDDWSLIATIGPAGPHFWPEGALIEVGEGFKSIVSAVDGTGRLVPIGCAPRSKPTQPALRLVTAEPEQ